jgi:N-acetylmuramoyl-L-alanine amidase
VGKDITTIAHPKDLELAVPPIGPGGSGMTLRQVAKGFSDWVASDWKRACNVEYRSGPSGPPVSLIIEGGKVWSRGDMRWPAFLVTGDKAEIIDSADHDKVTTAKFAFSAGPWLVRNETVCNISDEVRRGGFTGLMEGAQRERAAIGLRHDGMVVHYATMASTLLELAEVMKDLGCVSAINLDGGGSVGVLEGDKLFGYSVRHVACALMFREVMEGEPVAPEPQPVIPVQPASPGGDSKMYICIDPGHGGSDPGAVSKDGAQEKVVNLFVAQRIKTYLERAGAKVLMARTDDSDVGLAARAAKANQAKCDYFVSIHANAADAESANGYEVFHYPGSSGGVSLANKVSGAYKVASGMPLRRVTSANVQVLRDTAMPAILIELGFLTSPLDLALLKEPAFLDKLALGIAFGILDMRA